MHEPRCWRQLLAIVLVAIVLPAPIYANASSTDDSASFRVGASNGASSDQQAVSRELALFRGSAVSLSQAMAIAEALHMQELRPPISASTARRIHRSTG